MSFANLAWILIQIDYGHSHAVEIMVIVYSISKVKLQQCTVSTLLLIDMGVAVYCKGSSIISTGEHRESIVAEISANGLHLAQDSFGNYVVQYILELQIPSAVSKLISQFEGNYVHLSRQKFSSHAVEKCLLVLDGQVRTMSLSEACAEIVSSLPEAVKQAVETKDLPGFHIISIAEVEWVQMNCMCIAECLSCLRKARNRCSCTDKIPLSVS